jgi:hypothetical protein
VNERTRVVVRSTDDVTERFLVTETTGTPVVHYIALALPHQPVADGTVAGPTLGLYDGAEPMRPQVGTVRLGASVTLASDAEVGEFIAGVLDRASGARPWPKLTGRELMSQAAFPSAAVFAFVFLVVLFATGNTGAAFVENFSFVSQVLAPAAAGLATGAGVAVISVRSRQITRKRQAAHIIGRPLRWAARQATQKLITEKPEA